RDSIRVEEMINYFDWDLPPPKKDPIAIYADVTDAPWKSDHLLARVALKAKEIDQGDRRLRGSLGARVAADARRSPPRDFGGARSAQCRWFDERRRGHPARVRY